MTTLQLHLFNLLYLAFLVVVAFLTRATARRIAGALAGGAAVGVVGLGIIALGEKVGWWHMAITWEAVLPDATVDRLRPLRVRLPHHLADCPPVRLARAGGASCRFSGLRPGAGPLVHETVPGMG